ncbi:thioredoxin family protein [Ruficoccus amylovorans]|uniref:Thioredoxin family protein n=1 Tax=Ruficoccus amylovorans TaxID=1804625 RepID=A0A842HF05_9BACT|nr:thioredoxin family protein [Ruficoccus amylovorans]MBC2595103.1 thioredoxin family protein [Ruficoccus amylovorans]
MKILTYPLIVIAFLGAAFAAQGAPKPGDKAPDFTLQGADGKEYTLSDYEGQYVILEWLNHGCPYVKKHYDSGNMPATQAKQTADGVVWLSIVSSAPGKQGYETPEQTLKTAEAKGSKASAILLDPTGKVGKEYGAKRTPEMFIINPEGEIVYHGAIDSISSASQADIKDAKNYVNAAMAEAKAGQPVSQASTQPYGCGVKYPN